MSNFTTRMWIVPMAMLFVACGVGAGVPTPNAQGTVQALVNAGIAATRTVEAAPKATPIIRLVLSRDDAPFVLLNSGDVPYYMNYQGIQPEVWNTDLDTFRRVLWPVIGDSSRSVLDQDPAYIDMRVIVAADPSAAKSKLKALVDLLNADGKELIAANLDGLGEEAHLLTYLISSEGRIREIATVDFRRGSVGVLVASSSRPGKRDVAAIERWARMIDHRLMTRLTAH